MATNILNLNFLCFYFMTRKSYEGATTGAASEYPNQRWVWGLPTEHQTRWSNHGKTTGFESWRGTLYNTDSALWIPVSSCSEKKDRKANPFPWSSANSTVLLLERLYFDISITESFSCQLGATQIECGIVEWFSNSIRHLGSLHFLSKKEVLLFIYLSADGSCCTSQSIAQ